MLSLLAPNGEPVNFQSKNVSQWQGAIPVAGDYSIEVTLPSGASPVSYKLTIINLALVSTPTVTPTTSVPMVSPNSILNPPINTPGSITPPITVPR